MGGGVQYTEGIWGVLEPRPPHPQPVPPLRSRLEVKDGRLVQAELLWTKQRRRSSTKVKHA